ncbi:MAG: Gfo/Idh/MocA family protein [Blastocatellia bacterium]
MKFGLIGAGGIGKVRAAALGNTPGCELVAIMDVDAARARALAPTDRTAIVTDYKQMLAIDELDALIVSTPPQFHEEIVIAALETGKHVLCEKPLAPAGS